MKNTSSSTICRILIIGGLTLNLPGCTNTGTAAVASLKEVFHRQPSLSGFDPTYEYLQLATPIQQATLALGYSEKFGRQTREIWYSADKTTFQLEEGRYHSSKNLEINWQETKLHSAPKLEDVNRAQTYSRERLQMPGHRGPYQETVTIEPIPPSAAPKESPHYLIHQSEWLKESVINPAIPMTEVIVAYYARDPKTKKIIWAMQCLSENFCLRWQRLSVK